MDLSEKSAGLVLLGAYHYLQAEDLKLTCKTWRSLVVTSLLVAVHTLCENKERERAKSKLRNSVAHWWSSRKADKALEVFTRRETFQKETLNQEKIASLYYDLRARALGMSGQDDDSSSGFAVCELSLEKVGKKLSSLQKPTGVFAEAQKPLARTWNNSGDFADRSGASLAFSESKSRSGLMAYHNDGYDSDHSVLSI
jgi:hypothetical protein